MREEILVFHPGPGRVKGSPIKLRLKPGFKPRRLKARICPYAKRDALKREIDLMVEQGYWTKITYSPWATPLVLVEKPNNRLRMCADYRITLNPELEPVEHPLPASEKLFSRMAGCTRYTKLDLAAAYNQIRVDPQSALAQAMSTFRAVPR